jgi:hypothetical protein
MLQFAVELPRLGELFSPVLQSETELFTLPPERILLPFHIWAVSVAFARESVAEDSPPFIFAVSEVILWFAWAQIF